MKYKKHIFPSGVRAVFIPMKDNPTITFAMYACTGALYESDKQSGISHFLEHMCFKGTKNHPTPNSIALELDEIGASYNAYTSLEKTCYHVKASAEHLGKISEIVSDIYLNSIFPEEEIKKEKGVVLGEIDMYNDDPKSKIDDILSENMYAGTPAARSTLGLKKTVSAISKADLINYHDSQYKAENTIIVVAGGVSEKEMFKVAEKISRQVKTGKWKSIYKTKDKKQNNPESTIFTKDTDQAHLIIAFRGLNSTHKDRYVADMIARILRSGMSSRLWMRLREKMGSGYYVSAYNWSFSDFGTFYISTGTKPDRVSEIIKAIIEEVTSLKNELVGDKEMNKVREIVRSRLKMGLESSDDVADFFGNQEVERKEIKTPEEYEKLVSSITAKDIMRVAKTIFTNNRMNLAVIGPIKDKTSIEKVLTF